MSNRDCPNWESLGFASSPHLAIAKGTEQIFRCYSSTPRKKVEVCGQGELVAGSFLYGNCFFAPKVSEVNSVQNTTGLDRQKRWTGIYLESQLNAWFWGNDFDRIAMFRIQSSVEYWIGPVGQETLAASPYTNRSTGLVASHQRHLPWPNVASELLQVVLLPCDSELQTQISLLETWKVLGSIGKWGSA